MDKLIVGLFHEHANAEATAAELLQKGYAREAMSVFYVNPQGQHALHPIGGDEDESPGTHEARGGAAVGALTGGGAGAVLGALSIPVLGPLGPIVGAAAGAYGGSLVGALKSMERSKEEEEEAARPQHAEITGDTAPPLTDDGRDTAPPHHATVTGDAAPAGEDDSPPAPRKAGFLVAVAIKDPAREQEALDILDARAEEVEVATGELQDGDWIDFDPRRPKKLILGAGTGPLSRST